MYIYKSAKEFHFCFIVSKFKFSSEIKMKLNTHIHSTIMKTEKKIQEVKIQSFRAFNIWLTPATM